MAKNKGVESSRYTIHMRRLFLLVFSSLFIVLAFESPSIHAQQAATTGIGIAPLHQEGEIEPGFVYSGNLLIKNNGSQAQVVDIEAESFNVTDQAYNYLFTPGTTESSWVSFDKPSLTLSAGANDTVNYQVSVPLGAQPGGYYLALFAITHPSDMTSGGIAPTERVASLLYLTVSGDATRTGKLIQLHSPLVVFGGGSWSATLQNSGTLHYRSVYSASIRDVLDHQVSVSQDSRLILPNSVRLIDAPLTPPVIMGLYKVVYTIGLGDTPAAQETRWFLYLPPLQVGLLVLIIAGVTLIVLGRQKHRRGKRS